MRIGIVRTAESPCQCAQSVIKGLEALGHAFVLADSEEIEFRAPELARECNLVIDHTDTFRGQGLFRPLVRLLLEMEGGRIVGSDSRACFLADDKIAAKARLAEAGIPVPPGVLFRSKEEIIPSWLKPPLVLKPAFEHMSRGLGVARSVEEARTLAAGLLARHQQPLMVEMYIPGRELAVSLLEGPEGLEVLPPLEWRFEKRGPGVLTEDFKLKDLMGERRDACRADLSPRMREDLETLSRRAFQVLGLRDYARFDLRLSPGGTFFFLEANTTPSLEPLEALALSAKWAGLDYPALVERMLSAALRRYGHPSGKLSRSHNSCGTSRAWEIKELGNGKIRISKHEYRNKFKSRIPKIPNERAARKSFRSLENSDLGIVSDFGFRNSDFIMDLPRQNKPPVSSKPVMGKDQSGKEEQKVRIDLPTGPVELSVPGRVHFPPPSSIDLARILDVKAGESVLDFGCGTGLLSIAAAKRGARRVVATDLDPQALETTAFNARANGVGEQIEVRAGSWYDALGQVADRGKGGRFEVILATPPQTPGPHPFGPRYGGWDGTRHLFTVIEGAQGFLEPSKGRLWLLAISLANPSALLKKLREYFSEVSVVRETDRGFTAEEYESIAKGLFGHFVSLRASGQSEFKDAGGGKYVFRNLFIRAAGVKPR